LHNRKRAREKIDYERLVAHDKLIEHKRSFEIYELCVRERTTAADGRAHGDSQIQKCVSCDRWPPYHSSLSSSIL